MRKFLVLIALASLVTGSAFAVVGGPEPGEGEMAIMSGGSSASATTSVDANGTEWRSEISNLNSSCMSGNMSTGLEFGEFEDVEEGQKVEFSGAISTANPCATIETEVSEVSDNSYSMELVEKSGNGTCVSCVGVRKIEGSFTAEGEYTLEVVKDGETVEEVETPGYGEEENDKGGFPSFGFFVGLLQSLFS
ncbi:hypothetical protein ACK3SF_01365 [Candidatus Nanosalina sp. VS9-1]|uniref:hypothetical protein n=1 Tax=Candidatus Nanosalina sp. VS9-1 TaxID=3388566 RepID=UPI0039E01F33